MPPEPTPTINGSDHPAPIHRRRSSAIEIEVNASDPFAPRPGRTLAWKNVSLIVSSTATATATATDKSKSTTRATRKEDNKKTILHPQQGQIEPTQLTAIMGGSGAGKSSLLNVLAGKINGKEGVVTRDVTLDGVSIDPSSRQVKRKIAFVEQHDTLLSTATPQEALMFSAKLRLKSDLSNEAISLLVDCMLQELHLDQVQNTLTGNLSGGEKRRLSLGIELVVRPSILFCDEITSGLDSHNATSVMNLLKKVAECGATVLVTLHQPNSKIFNMLDALYLMKQGQCIYHGPVAKVAGYFENRGFSMPIAYGTADWILEVAQTETMDALVQAGFQQAAPATSSSTDGKYDERTTAMIKGDTYKGETASDDSFDLSSQDTQEQTMPRAKRRLSIFDQNESPVSVWTQVRIQLQRDARKIMRDKRVMTLRFTIVIVASSVIAITFKGAGTNSLEDMQFFSHVGAMFFLIMTNMIALQLVMLDQIEGRPIYVKEYTTDHFGLFAYLLAKFISEAIVGFLQVFLLLVICFFAIDLQGDFWFWLLSLYSFLMIMSGAGVALSLFTRDARDAKELIPILLLPNILFAGFFVQIDARKFQNFKFEFIKRVSSHPTELTKLPFSLTHNTGAVFSINITVPVYLRWVQWCVPLTYAFRLILNNEFQSCVGGDFDAEALMKSDQCLSSLLNAIQGADGGFQNLYREYSYVRLPQTGQYMGQMDIREYLNLFSEASVSSNALIADFCQLDGATKIQFNGISDNGICDITFAEIGQGRFNDHLINPALEDAPFTQYAFGHRLMFRPEGDDMIDLLTHDIYYPLYFATGLFEEGFSAERVALDICSTLQDNCPESYARDGYNDLDDCLARMGSLPLTNLNDQGFMASDGNSTTCRVIHANLAKNNKKHCPHISYYPEEDINGNILCSTGYNTNFDNFFSESDLQLFQELAKENNLDSENQLVWGLQREDLASCRTDFESFGEEIIMSLPDDFVGNRICVSYLDAQNATGENNGIYWAAMAAFFVVTRAATFYLSRRLVTVGGGSNKPKEE